MTLPLTPVELAIVLTVSTIAATVQATTGFGLTMVAAPALVMIDDAFVPAPLLIAGLIIASRHMIADRAHIDRGATARSLTVLPVGIGAGLGVRLTLPSTATDIAIGATICLVATVLLTGRSPRRTPSTELIGGFSGGLAGMVAGLPGPPLVLALHDLKPAALRSTASVFMTAVAALTVISLAATDDFAAHELRLTAALAPGILAGLVAGRHCRPWLDRRWFRQAVLFLSLAAGCALIASRTI